MAMHQLKVQLQQSTSESTAVAMYLLKYTHSKIPVKAQPQQCTCQSIPRAMYLSLYSHSNACQCAVIECTCQCCHTRWYVVVNIQSRTWQNISVLCSQTYVPALFCSQHCPDQLPACMFFKVKSSPTGQHNQLQPAQLSNISKECQKPS